MPFLRILRDKRGIEHFYLLHPLRTPDGVRPQVIYYFRTSSAGRLGRLPLDEEARQAIEAQFPAIRFDWRALWQESTTTTVAESASPPRARRGSRPPVGRGSPAPTEGLAAGEGEPAGAARLSAAEAPPAAPGARVERGAPRRSRSRRKPRGARVELQSDSIKL